MKMIFSNFIFNIVIWTVCIANCSGRPKDVDTRAGMGMRNFVEGDTGTTDWNQVAQNEILESLTTSGLKVGKAKNLIIFIGDGMGLSTVTPARIYHAQSRGLIGREAMLAFDTFPHTGLTLTYNTNRGVGDSAATGTALLVGEKAHHGTVGLSQHVKRGNCTAQKENENELLSVMKIAMKAGKVGGVVATSRLTHATPAASYAVAADRDWESDQDVADALPEDQQSLCVDIAQQLVDNPDNANIKVILGGGRKYFTAAGVPDPEYPDDAEEVGKRLDGRNLTKEWVENKIATGLEPHQVQYVMNKEEFDAVDHNSVDYLMGMFEPDHMHYEADRTTDKEVWGEPSLAEMTEKAIQILARNLNGFYLMVEASRIDHAHHESLTFKAMNDTVALSDAVKKAVELTNSDDTLIIVTADHSHSFSYNGYQTIDNNVLGLADEGKAEDGTFILRRDTEDGKPYMALSYTNGPGFANHRLNETTGEEMPRRDLTEDQAIIGISPDYLYDTGIWKDSETHAGEDIPVYAIGPMSHIFQGVHEQNFIAHAMMYAACIGPNQDHCNKPRQYPGCPDSTSAVTSNLIGSENWIIVILSCLSVMYLCRGK